jgi:hypothetical protein
MLANSSSRSGKDNIKMNLWNENKIWPENGDGEGEIPPAGQFSKFRSW